MSLSFRNPWYNRLSTRDGGHFRDFMRDDLSFFGLDNPVNTLASWVTKWPHFDVKQTDTEYVVEADLPGVDKADINVNFEDDTLTVSAERKDGRDMDNGTYTMSERHYGKFSRSVHLEGATSENVSAVYTDGVLTVTVPRVTHQNSRVNVTVK